MLTQWGKALDKEHILPDYPRPQFRRSNCEILNGAHGNTPSRPSRCKHNPERFETFSLPFRRRVRFPASGAPCCRASASGIAVSSKPRRGLTQTPRVDPAPGAIDQFAEVRLNGVTLLHHAGGYLPFSVVLSDVWLSGVITASVIARAAKTDKSCWSRETGNNRAASVLRLEARYLWQTVWLERAPKRRIETVVIASRFLMTRAR